MDVVGNHPDPRDLPGDGRTGAKRRRIVRAHWIPRPLISAKPWRTSTAWLNCSSPPEPISMVATEGVTLMVWDEPLVGLLLGLTGSVFLRARRMSASRR